MVDRDAQNDAALWRHEALVTARTAILGYGCRLPGAADPDSLWALLVSGRCSVSRVGPDRWEARGLSHPDRQATGTTYSAAAGLLDDPFAFDAGFFGISQREAMQMDPQQRLLLQVGWEAIEMAGLTSERLCGPRTGVFVGCSGLDYGNAVAGDPAAADSRFMTGNTLSIIANRLAHFLDAQGPSYVIDTACSSALFAFHAACRAIETGEIDVAVVGGVNLLLTPMPFIGFSRAAMLSPTGLCKPFDHRADGYVRAEGAVAFVIASEAWAQAGGDRVRGLVLGTAVNSDGRAQALSVPNSLRQADLMRGVYARAGIDPDTLAFIEAHGTGTAVGDPQEARAIGEAIGRHRSRPLPVGSIKSNIGHLEPAAGLAGLLKAQLALERGVLPPTLHIEALNPAIPFDELNIAPAAEAVPLGGSAGPLAAGVNAFGFGGANAHVAIRQPDPVPDNAPEPTAEPAAAPLLLSAASEASLRALATRWRARLAGAGPAEAAALSNAAAHRRTRLSHRLVVTPTEPEARLAALDAFVSGQATADAVSDTALAGAAQPVAFLFSGNGAQWPGMGCRAHADDPAFRHGFDAFAAAVADMGGPDLGEALHAEDLEARLGDAETAQPLLVGLQIGLVEALAARGVRPAFVAGHSVGEVAAAWACGALDIVQAARLTMRRARCQRPLRHTGGMAAVLAGIGALDPLLAEIGRDDLGLAADNSPRGTTVSGPSDAIEALIALARARRVAVRRLKVDYPFHGPMMERIRAPLLEALADIAPGPARIPFVSTALGEVVAGEALDADYWWQNARRPVLFRQSVQRLAALGAGVFVEIGPQPMLQNYVQDTLAADGAAGRFVPGYRRQGPGAESSGQVAARVLAAGGAIDEAAVFGRALPQGDSLPAYPWDEKRYRIEGTSDAINLMRRPAARGLLGWRTAPGEGPWRITLDSRAEPWLADHRVDGSAVLPAAAFVELALAAGAESLGDGPIELTDFDILRPLQLDGPRMDLRTHVETGGAVRIEGRPHLAADGWALHGAGTVRRAAAPAPPAADPVEPGATPDAGLYAALADLGLAYGPAFARAATPVSDGEDTLHAALAPSAVETVGRWMLDPTALDAAFHLLAPLLARSGVSAPEPGLCYLPTRIGRLQLHAPGRAAAAVAARLTRRGLRTVEASFTLRDAAGAAVATVTGARFTAVRLGHGAARVMPFWREAMVPIRLDPDQPSALPAAWREPARRLEALGLAAAAETEPSPQALIVEAACRRIAWDAARALALHGGVAFRARRALPPGLAAALLCGLSALAADGAYDEAADRVSEVAPVPSLHALVDALLTTAPDQAGALAAVLRLADAFERRRDLDRHRRESPLAGWDAVADALRALAADWPAGAPFDVALGGHPPEHLVAQIEALGMGRVVRLGAEAPAGGFDVIAAVDDGRHAAGALGRLGTLLAPGGLLLALWPEESLLSAMLRAAEGERGGPDADLRPELTAAGLPAHHPIRAVSGTVEGVAAVRPPLAATADGPRGHASDTRAVTILADGGGPGLMAAVGLREALSARGCVARVVTDPAEPPDGDALVLMTGCCARDPASPEAVALRFAALRAALDALRGSTGGPRPAVWIASLAPRGARPADLALERIARVLANERPDLTVRCAAALCDEPSEAARDLARAILAPLGEPALSVGPAGAAAPRVMAAPGLGEPSRRSADGADVAFALQPGQTGNLDALRWAPVARRAPGPGEVEIAVAATGLNFRDVMWAMGMLPEEAIEEGFAGTGLGMECGGVVVRAGRGARWAEGTRVVAFAAGAFATHVTVPDSAAVEVPEGMDLAHATSLPVAMATAYRGLVDLGQLAPGETVLVHGGAGAVGLAALQLARARGARILATAGSPEKRALLRLLGADDVFDSRSLDFAEAVMAATEGRGVDIALNSLSGEAMERTLGCMAAFGRFIELGKRDFYANGRVGLRPLRRNVAFHGVDLDAMLAARPASAGPLLAALAGGLGSGEIVPLPHTVFAASGAVEAFRLMQRSGHMGKIIVTPPATAPSRALPPPLARADGAWLVTGGTRGFGLALAERLAQRGAGAIWLASRSGRIADRDAAVLERMRACGARVECIACDVTKEAALAELLSRIAAEGPPLRGIAHAATVLDDALFRDVDPERLTATMRPKLAGANLLDRLSRGLPLDHFLLFSSVAALFGNPGQTAYVAANGAIEAVARTRRAAGLPALAIQWGPIADTGLLAGDAAAHALLERRGAGLMTAAEAIDRLERLLETAPPHAVVAIAPMRWGALAPDVPLVQGPLFERVDRTAGGGPATGGLDDLRAALDGLDDTAALRRLVDLFRAEAAIILRQPPEDIDPGRPMVDLGFDSLMAVELKLSAEDKHGLVLPVFSLSEGATINAVAARVLADLRRRDGDAAAGSDADEALARRHLGGEAVGAVLARLEDKTSRRTGSDTP